MHFRNGRKAKNGDRVVQLSPEGKIVGFGILYDSGDIAYVTPSGIARDIAHVIPGGIARFVDCMHADDVAALLAEKGLDKRPSGK